MNMDYLKDIVQHTQGLGIIELVKITGKASETQINAMSADRSVIVSAKTTKPIPEFLGEFGMPNLSKLNVILGIPEYGKDAKISVIYKTIDKQSLPSGLQFENASGDFKNEYRFMSAELVKEQLKALTFKGATWDVTFEPSAQNILRFKYMASANSEETTFVAKTEGNSLKFYFGDHSSHAGSFVFAEGVTGVITNGFHWPVSVVASILALPGDKKFQISDEGAAQIIVDSGLSVYTYILPAQQK